MKCEQEEICVTPMLCGNLNKPSPILLCPPYYCTQLPWPFLVQLCNEVVKGLGISSAQARLELSWQYIMRVL